MLSILREFAEGNLNPSERGIAQTAEYRAAVKTLMESEQKMIALLTDEEMAVFEQFNTAHMNFSGMENNMKFTQGFVSGALMMMEIMAGRDDLFAS